MLRLSTEYYLKKACLECVDAVTIRKIESIEYDHLVADVCSARNLGGEPRQRSSPGRVKNFLFSMSSRRALGPTHPPIQWVPGALSPGVKRQRREANHSPPTSAEVKKMWIYTLTPPYALMA
jgi:hypothetical protein